jgi:hypothetical protein
MKTSSIGRKSFNYNTGVTPDIVTMGEPLTLPPPAEILRESFGDRRPPDITRKITACVACRKQKVLALLDPYYALKSFETD